MLDGRPYEAKLQAMEAKRAERAATQDELDEGAEAVGRMLSHAAYGTLVGLTVRA